MSKLCKCLTFTKKPRTTVRPKAHKWFGLCCAKDIFVFKRKIERQTETETEVLKDRETEILSIRVRKKKQILKMNYLWSKHENSICKCKFNYTPYKLSALPTCSNVSIDGLFPV